MINHQLSYQIENVNKKADTSTKLHPNYTVEAHGHWVGLQLLIRLLYVYNKQLYYNCILDWYYDLSTTSKVYQ